jgi:HepT-like protein
MSDEYVALIGRLEQTLFDLDRVVSRTEKQMKQAVTTNDDAYLDAAALNLHGFYAGVERTFEDIAQTLSEALPVGSHWHQNLLLQMSNEISGIRPAVITVQTRYCLDEYRQFRHVVRNVYTLSFRLSSIQSLVANLRACLNIVTQDLNNFIQFLQQLVND